jgi:hypothetical protein
MGRVRRRTQELGLGAVDVDDRMLLVTTPPQPASNARRMLLSDSVGGAEASRKGFSNRRPANVTLSFALIGFRGRDNYTSIIVTFRYPRVLCRCELALRSAR